MDNSMQDFLKKIGWLKTRLESEVKLEFFEYLNDIKLRESAAQTNHELIADIKNALQTLGSSIPYKHLNQK